MEIQGKYIKNKSDVNKNKMKNHKVFTLQPEHIF